MNLLEESREKKKKQKHTISDINSDFLSKLCSIHSKNDEQDRAFKLSQLRAAPKPPPRCRPNVCVDHSLQSLLSSQ